MDPACAASRSASWMKMESRSHNSPQATNRSPLPNHSQTKGIMTRTPKENQITIVGLILLATLLITQTAPAQIGQPFIHDPSTIVECDGKYYTFGTGGGGLISEDGWKWHGGAVRPGGGAAPDAIKLGDRYLVAYGATGGSSNHKGAIFTMWNKTLDPNSPDFKYTDPVLVATSDGYEECDAIDPGLMLDPTTGKL